MARWALSLPSVFAVISCGGGSQSGSTDVPHAVGAATTIEAVTPVVADASVKAAAIPAAESNVGGMALSPPYLAGTPYLYALAGDTYDFAPIVVNPPLTPMNFTAVNLPPWASIDPATGELSGAPSPAQVGHYDNIAIVGTFADPAGTQSTATIGPFSVTVVPTSDGNRSITINWQPPTLNTNGTPLTDLAGYKIYMQLAGLGAPHTVIVSDPTASSFTVQGLLPGMYNIAMTAFNAANQESTLVYYPASVLL